MCHALLQDPVFFRFLKRIDEEFAAKTRLGRCQRCGAALHSDDYPRKPRGVPTAVVDDYSKRLSFTCSRCDKRATPASVRFFGRRVYVAIVLMLVSPPGTTRGQALCDLLTIPERTMCRWRSWWSRDFVRTAFWQSRRERFAIPVMIAQLPQSLLERFAGDDTGADRMSQLLRFLAPLSTRSVAM